MSTNLLNSHLQFRCHFEPPKTPNPPAIDRVIDFGKHKGKPLGALPSTYLKWVSATLRTRNTQHWAHLADQVLNDPIYRDRIEWEFAENVLHGTARNSRSGAAVKELLEISERFGWDNDDKDAWKRVDFRLLGTSKGGRIPRKKKKVMEIPRVQTERVKKTRESRIIEVQSVKKENEKEKEKEKEKVYNPFPGREGLLRDVLRGRRFF